MSEGDGERLGVGVNDGLGEGAGLLSGDDSLLGLDSAGAGSWAATGGAHRDEAIRPAEARAIIARRARGRATTSTFPSARPPAE
ncbi:MAG: hypothetical protein ACO3YU_05870 [Candidatus Nanopelagicales bacterium]